MDLLWFPSCPPSCPPPLCKDSSGQQIKPQSQGLKRHSNQSGSLCRGRKFCLPQATHRPSETSEALKALPWGLFSVLAP